MKVIEIIESEDQNVIVSELRNKRFIEDPDIAASEKALDPLKHDIFNKALRPDKKVRVDAEELAGSDENTKKVVQAVTTEDGDQIMFRHEPVARIALDLPGLIVKRAAAMIFGNEVELNADPADENQEKVLAAIEKIRNDVKERSFNRRVAKTMFSATEVAELWWAVPVNPKKPNEKSEKYGINTSFKLRCALLSPMKGESLYPYFDATGDMIAFSREYTRTDQDKKVHTYFETWTDEEHVRWEKSGNAWEEEVHDENVIGKIPVVFGNQEETEFAKIMILVDRLEKLLSNFADTNDYHASPKIFVQGEVKGFSKKGEAGSIIEGEDGADAKYLSWANAPESVKLEIETLLKMIYTITQTPDISFDSVKGLNLSGVALKLLFMDAHLKVQDHLEVFDEYLQRRYNIIKAFVGQMDKSLEAAANALDVVPEVTPYMITDESSDLTMWANAAGGKAIVSRRTAIRKAGVVDDIDAELEEITNEEDRTSSIFAQEPTNYE